MAARRKRQTSGLGLANATSFVPHARDNSPADLDERREKDHELNAKVTKMVDDVVLFDKVKFERLSVLTAIPSAKPVFSRTEHTRSGWAL